MEPTELLENFIKVLDDLNQHGISEKFLAHRKLLVTLLDSYLLQLKYENLRSDFGEPNSVDVVMSDGDRKKLKEATTVNRQIGKRLREIKEGKI